jgi:Sulfotransferase family
MKDTGAGRKRLPDFILGGAMKAGTTTVWSWLSQHPAIGMAAGKEPRFFTAERGLAEGGEADAPLRSGRYDEGFDWYASLFQHCAGRTILGEASSRYLHAPDAADLIRAALPDVRLVFILRDPVERAYAHYRQELRTLTGLPEFSELVRGRHPRLRRYLADSSYGTLLGRYYSQFDSGRILLLLTEDLGRDACSTAARIFGFLGVEASLAPDLTNAVNNPSSASRSRRLNSWLTMKPLGRLKNRLPRPLSLFGSHVRRALVEMNTVTRAPAALEQSLRLELVGLLGKEIDETERIVQRDLSKWRSA